ncbi:MAG: ABC transporter ATP-binding protein [Candidatus Zixiibacteriota bacterium]
MTDQAIIKIENISKIFRRGLAGKDIKALVNVSLDIFSGDIFGLLGPNGAGKTTLVKILLGALSSSSGHAFINNYGVSDARARERIGFLPENHRFPEYQTGRQMLQFYGGLAGLGASEIKTRATEVLKLVDMEKWGDTRIKKYSKGMMQRLGLAQALLNDPEIIFLDEPTDGVDPIGRREIRDVLKELKSRGKTIFLNSHLLAEVESICDKVAILNFGRLIKVGPVEGLTTIKPTYNLTCLDLTDENKTIIQNEFGSAIIKDNNIEISFKREEQINELIDLLRDNAISIKAIIPVKISLEDSFMQLIKDAKTEAANE